MEFHPAKTAGNVAAAESAVWDWGNLLDFTVDGGFHIEEDDPLIFSWGSSDVDQTTTPPPPPPVELSLGAETQAVQSPEELPGMLDGLNRVRKRDPRLVCPNYLAGRVPCACPELDEKVVEEAAAAAGERKRAKKRRAAAAARCQVPGCETDISELKGYHKRHRVCLRCANASSVLLDGEQKRYCQQCGKFHMLPDFDEGKRSCRRKLERHNKRRRRRPIGSGSVVEKEMEAQEDFTADVTYDDEPRNGTLNESTSDTVETVVSNRDGETLLTSEYGQGSPIGSIPSSRNDGFNSTISFPVCGEVQLDERINNSLPALSSTLCDNKAVYSSVCPTGRISFKLYDWNPAEFPRRLRLQIFQWLANMPVELEGYIRPGCTILTVFIAMPHFMWEKLSRDAAHHIRDLINAPESLLLGRGNILIYLNNMIIQVLKDGTSLTSVKMEVHTPRLHYVYPTYFEAGKPMEFVACGSNLEQPKFRFLVSFAGKYLKYDSCNFTSPKNSFDDRNAAECNYNSEHEIVRIKVAHTDPEVFGPAFIEVENVFGVSNFIPVLVGNKQICSELERIEEAFGSLCHAGVLSENVISGPTHSMCEVLLSKKATMSTLFLDLAWLLKEPHADQKEALLNPINIQRLISLFKFLLQNEFLSILEVIMHHLDNIVVLEGFDKSDNCGSSLDLNLLNEYIRQAREILYQRSLHDGSSEVQIEPRKTKLQNNIKTDMSAMHHADQDKELMSQESASSSTEQLTEDVDANIPLVSKETIHRQGCNPKLGLKYSWNDIFSTNMVRMRHALVVIVSIVLCFSACIMFLHPHKAGEFVGSIRCTFVSPCHI